MLNRPVLLLECVYAVAYLALAFMAVRGVAETLFRWWKCARLWRTTGRG